jgi:hypothetical protein
MQRLSAIVFSLVLVGAGSAFAQTGPMPGMGATSPLGSMNFNAPSGPVGIPLGATELAGSGTSPLPGVTQCTPGTITGIGAAASAGVFDGGGAAIGTSASGGVFDGGGASMGSGMSGCAASGNATAPTMPNTPAAGLQGSTIGTTIPLGSVEVANPGVSPPIGVPAPTIGTTP